MSRKRTAVKKCCTANKGTKAAREHKPCPCCIAAVVSESSLASDGRFTNIYGNSLSVSLFPPSQRSTIQPFGSMFLSV